MRTPYPIVPALALPTTARYAQFVQIDMRDPPWPYLSDLVAVTNGRGVPRSFFAAASTQVQPEIYGFTSPDGLDGVLPDWYQHVPAWLGFGYLSEDVQYIRDYLRRRTRHLEVSRGRSADSRGAAAGAVAAIPSRLHDVHLPRISG